MIREQRIFVLTLALSCYLSAAATSRPGVESTLYRFDDNWSAAAVKTSPRPSSARLAEPVTWRSFDTAKDAAWTARGGVMIAHNSELVVQSAGVAPVVISPKSSTIDWNLYEAVRVRMRVEAGAEVTMKIGTDEFKQKLGPPGQHHVYRFDVNGHDPRAGRSLSLVPTDSLSGQVAISFIELVPRLAYFPEPIGRKLVGKQEDHRNALYVHTPASLTYTVRVPERARLRFSLGVAEKRAVTFRVAAEGIELFRRTLEDPLAWEDVEVDLSRLGGRTIRLVFEAHSALPGVAALWANPLMTATGEQRRPNVLLYLVCSLRPDHMSLYGYARDSTPFLKRLGAAGVVFDDAQAQGSWTKTSVPSLMTSLSSHATGIMRENDTIPAGATTLAEQLRRAGYVTASFVTNPFAGRASGLERGFDYLTEYSFLHRRRSQEEDRGVHSAELHQALVEWLERHRDEPFFLYAHSSDPHAPYRPPQQFEAKFANPAETAQFHQDERRLRAQRFYAGGVHISRADSRRMGINPDRFLKQALERYDAEIAYNDSTIEQLTGKLRELGVLNNTLLIVVSDHGEEFWEHGWIGHGHSLYQELTRAAWLMWNPKLLPSPKRIGEPVQLMDLVPTVLDLLRTKPSGILQGQSLAPLVRGQRLERRTPLMSSYLAPPPAETSGDGAVAGSDTFALTTRDWKLIWRNQAQRASLPETELYDRRTDRAETRDVAVQYPKVVQRLKAEMDQWIEAQQQVRKLVGAKGQTSLSPKAIARLRSLGYIGK